MTIRDDIIKLNKLTGLGVTEQTWPQQRFQIPHAWDEAVLTVVPCQQSDGRELIDLELWENFVTVPGGPRPLIRIGMLIENGKAAAYLNENGGVNMPLLFRINAESVLKRIKEAGFVRCRDRNDIRKQFLKPAPRPA